MKSLTITLAFSLLPLLCHTQNIGIGAPEPSEKLEVGGMIYTNDGGIKFPDQTVQTTAANNTPYEASADENGFIIMEVSGYPTPDDTAGFMGIRVIDFSYHVQLPYDSQSGGTTSTPVHMPVRIAKAIDETSPLFFKDLVQAALIPEIKLHFLRPDANNVLAEYYEIQIQNCKIVDFAPGIRFLGGDNWAHFEEIAFIYETITLTHTLSGVTHTDSWVSSP